MVIVSINSFALQCIPKTSCFFHSTIVLFMNVATNDVTVTVFSSEMIILEILWGRIRISEHLAWENNTLRNSASDIVIQCLCG